MDKKEVKINIINFEEFQDVVINAKKLIKQIEMANYKEENGFRLKNNIHYKELAESIDELID